MKAAKLPLFGLHFHDHALKILTFTVFLSNAIIYPYFPLYFNSIGLSIIQIGLLYSLGPAVGIFSNLLWGMASDRFQTIKSIIITILLGQLVMSLFISQIHSFGLLFVFVIFFFFFQTPTNSLLDSLTLLTIDSSKKSYASFRVWGSFGFAFSALMFGFILKEIGIGAVPAVIATTIFGSLLISMLVKDRKSLNRKTHFSGLKKVLGSKELIWFLSLLIILSIASRVNDNFMALYMVQMGATESMVGWSWMMSALCEIPVFLYLGKYGHKYRELPLLAVASFAYVIRFFLMSIVTDPLWIIAIQAMHALTFGIYFITAIRYIQRLVPDEYRATGQAVLAIVWFGVSGLFSGTLGGWVFEVWGGQTMYLVSSLLALIACLGFVLMHLIKKET